MVRLLAVLVLAGASVDAQTVTQVFGSGAYSFSMEFVTIGSPGNAGDTTGLPSPAGSVPYVYNLGKYEVSRDMVLKASTAGGLGLTLQDMTSYGGNGANRPATGISWNEAARFVNWLNATKGYAPAYNFTTSGPNDYMSVWAAGQYSGSNPYRHKNALFFLPSVDEWYKAAYGSPSGAWFNYPNGSDIKPAMVSNGSTGAVYGMDFPGSSPADISDAGGLSAFGTMAQGGNAWEWMENLAATVGSDAWIGEIRGGSWQTGGTIHDNLASHNRDAWLANTEFSDLGFRVAMVPEPSSLSLLLAGGAVLMAGRRGKQD